MADLQSLRDSLEQFESLEADLTDLNKKKEGLEQDCITLASKQERLSESIKTATDKLTEIQAAQNKIITEHEAEIAEVDKRKITVQNEVTQIESRLDDTQKAFDKQKEEQETTLASLNDEITAIKQDITIAESQKLGINTEISTLKEVKKTIAAEIVEAKAQKTIYDQETADKLAHNAKIQAENNTKTAEAQKAAKTAQNEHIGILSDIEKAKTELEDTRRKNGEFLEAERRAKKSLEAKEQSLIDREQQLAEKERRAGRSGVLDGISKV